MARRRRTTAAAACFAALFVVMPPARAVAQTPSTAAASVRLTGIVMATTGEPLAGADVRLLENGASTFTSPEGYFEFDGLPAGAYTVVAVRSGYLPGAPGASARQVARPIEIPPNGAQHVEIRLLPLGSITGRIVDDARRPARGIRVRAIRHAMLSPGGRAGAEVLADHEGRFAIRELDPGSYFVVAEEPPRRAAPPATASRAFATPSNVPPTATPPALSYFPGTAFPDQAVGVIVEAGVETDATFTLSPSRLARVSVTVLDAQGEPARGFLLRTHTIRIPQPRT